MGWRRSGAGARRGGATRCVHAQPQKGKVKFGFAVFGSQTRDHVENHVEIMRLHRFLNESGKVAYFSTTFCTSCLLLSQTNGVGPRQLSRSRPSMCFQKEFLEALALCKL
eukprot:1520343-Amphidinium_carterae.1